MELLCLYSLCKRLSYGRVALILIDSLIISFCIDHILLPTWEAPAVCLVIGPTLGTIILIHIWRKKSCPQKVIFLVHSRSHLCYH